MVALTRYTKRATPSVTKLVCLVLSIGVVCICAFSRPTELQECLVDSTWRENAIYIMGMNGIAFSALSLVVSTCTGAQRRFEELKYLDILLHCIGCLAYLFCGAAMLYSTLIIMTKIGDCCKAIERNSDVNCDLPGFLDGLEDSIKPPRHLQELPVPRSRFDIFYQAGVEVPPYLEKCHDEIGKGYWQCQTCVNAEVQPRYAMKGAAGALGILASIFYGVVVIVSVSEMRANAKEALKARAGLRQTF